MKNWIRFRQNHRQISCRALRPMRSCHRIRRRRIGGEQLEPRWMLAYEVVQFFDPLTQNQERRLLSDGFHFGSLLETPQGTVSFRGRPDREDADGFGSTEQINLFIAGPGVDATGGHLDLVESLGNGIHVNAGGTIAAANGGAGQWSWTSLITYDPAAQRIALQGQIHVGLNAAQSGDLNLGRISSNFLYQHSLTTGGTGNTGDMSSMAFDYGPDSPIRTIAFTPAPGMEATFPGENSSQVTVKVIGEVNLSDPLKLAIRKPTVEKTVHALDPNIKLIAGGSWDPLANGFKDDNAAGHHILKLAGLPGTSFDFELNTVWSVPAIDSFLASSAEARFVNALYPLALGRGADWDGLRHWTEPLVDGQPRGPIIANIVQSDEYAASMIVAPAYHRFLGRNPEPAGTAYWLDQLQHHGLSQEQFESLVAASPECVARLGGADRSWVEGLYVAVLGRPADAEGSDYWIARMAQGVARDQVSLGFVASLERRRQRVVDDYMTLLGRGSTKDDIDYWLEKFQHGTTPEDVIIGILASSESFELRTAP